jgi:ELWxxDGT repeat protein
MPQLRSASVLLSLTITVATFAANDTPYLVRDFPGPIRASGSLGALWTTLGNISWFVADSGDGRGSQVWKTDGTSIGTIRATDVIARRDGHVRGGFVGTVNGRLLYGGEDAQGGALFSLAQNGGAPVPLIRTEAYQLESGVMYRGALYFAADATQGGVEKGRELWRTDGTSAGTTSADLHPGEQGSIAHSQLEVAGEWIIFAGATEVGKGIFRTDGTVAGTTRLAPFPADNDPQHANLTSFGNSVVFVIPGLTTFTDELWITDGTPSGTRRFMEGAWNFRGHAVLDGKLIFEMSRTGGDTALWITDGTAEGTRRLNDIVTRNASLAIAGDVVGEKYFFFGADPDTDDFRDFALFTTKAIPNTTEKVRGGLDLGHFIFGGVAWNGRFYFGVEDVEYGKEWWSSDGTAAGTRMVGDVYPGTRSGFATGYALRRSDGLFTGLEGPSGHEPWIIDGTAAGTRLLKNIGLDVPRPGSNPRMLVAGAERLFFLAEHAYDRVIGRSNGTAGGTSIGAVSMLADWAVYDAVAAGNRTFLQVASLSGTRLLSSDGSENGSALLSTHVGSIASFADGILFQELSDNSARFSNGTPGGTHVIAPPEAYPDGGWQPYSANGLAWFTRYSQLAVSDGAAGMRIVESADATVQRGTIHNVIEGPNKTYFLDDIYDGEQGGSLYRLWRTDGTREGTRIVKTFSTLPQRFAESSDRLFFVVGNTLWSTDGTEGNTIALPATGGPRSCLVGAEMAAAGNQMVWYARQIDGSFILWKSDGTLDGTMKLLALDKALSGDGCPTVATFEQRAYFPGFDAQHGAELWVSDGTVAGTHMHADVFPGVPGSEPQELTTAAGHLFFSADAPEIGRELWAIGNRAQPRRRAVGH